MPLPESVTNMGKLYSLPTGSHCPTVEMSKLSRKRRDPPLTSTGMSGGKRDCKKSETTDSHTKRLRKKRGNGVKKVNGQLVLPTGRETSVYVSPSGVRVPFSIRIDSGIKRAWMQFVLDKGLSSCEIVEKTLLGIMHGYQAPVYANHTINVIVDFPRIVKRVRRRQLYFEDEVESVEISPGEEQSEISCSFCDKEAVGMATHLENGKKVFVCEYHRKCLGEHPKWEVLENEV